MSAPADSASPNHTFLSDNAAGLAPETLAEIHGSHSGVKTGRL